jgi:NAD(P)H-flavin reductase/hemoglobin-like flavoprotein
VPVGARRGAVTAMSRRPDSAQASTLPASDRSLAGQAAAERRSLPWWRLRTWRKDLDALTRLRDGLQAMEFDETADVAGAVDGDSAFISAAGSATTAAATAWPTAPADAASAGPVGTRVGSSPAGAGPLDDSRDAAAEAGAAAAAESAASSAGGADPAIVAIRDSFVGVASAGDEAVAYFYAWLFLRRPELRDLFPPAMDEQRDRLFRALGRIVESLSTPDEMALYLSQLGRDHRKYGVTPDMYDGVGEALIATLRAFAESAFTSEAEEAWTQTFAAAAALMIRAAEEDAAVAPAHWTAEVVQVERLTGDIAIVTIAPDRVLPYEAGQHLTLQTPRWPHVWRPYSIACRPREDGLISLHVKAVPGGWVSRALVHHTDTGDELILGPAMGTMTLRPAGRRDLLCVAGGTGLAPIKAIVEQAVRDSAATPRQIYLFYGARKREQLYDLKDLWRLADAYPGLQLAPVTSDDPAFDGMQGNVGRVAARYMPHTDFEAYVAGPADMVRETIRVLTRAGLPRERVHYDDALLAARARVGSGT